MGVLRSYSTLWVKNGELPLAEQKRPSGFVTILENNRLKKLTRYGWEHALFQSDNEHFFTQMEYKAQAWHATPHWQSGKPVTANTKMPLAFVLPVSLCAILVVFSIPQYTLARQKSAGPCCACWG